VTKLLIDNNIINKLLENIELFKKKRDRISYCVSAQIVEELANIPDSKKEDRIKLFISLAQIEAQFLLDSVMIWDISRFDLSKYGDGIVYNKILKESKNNIRDAIIADTAVSNDCILLTNDVDLYSRMKNFGYDVLNFDEFRTL